MRLFLFPVLVVSALLAQQFPAAEILMKRQEDSIRNHGSLQFVTDLTLEFLRNGRPEKMTGEVATAFQNPGKMRLESKMQGVLIAMVSDGATTWGYHSGSRQFTKQAAAPSTAGILEMLGLRDVPDLSKIPMTMKTLREDTVRVDGVEHECWVVEANLGKTAAPGAQGMRISGGVMDYWIDKKSDIALQIKISIKMTAPGMTEAAEMRQTMTKRDLRIDQPIPDAFFVFTPPEGSREVPELAGVGLPHVDLTGQLAGEFAVTGLDAKTYRLAGLRGKAVLLDFWTTWCGPCRSSMPVLEKIYAEYRSQGLVILGIDAGEELEKVESFLKNQPASYPNVLGGESEILRTYHVSSFPTYILIGRDGKIVAHQIGYGGEARLRAMLAKAGLTPKAK